MNQINLLFLIKRSEFPDALVIRKNIVLSRSDNLKDQDVTVFSDFSLLLSEIQKNEDECFIIGGEQVYKLFLPYAQKIYLSCVDYEGLADAYFPELDGNFWRLASEESYVATSTSPQWRFQVWERV